MRVLLTGAGGNLGRGVLRALVDHGHVVTAVGRNAGRLAAACAPFADTVEQSLCDLAAPGNLPFSDDYEAVVHTAAHASAQESPDAHVVHNILTTRHLLRHAARRPNRIVIFFSSLSVYGTIRDPEVDEKTAILNPGSYGASKLIGEMMLQEYGAKFASVALRLPGVLGPGARDPWLARVLSAARAGRPVSIYTPETPFNNALHVDELAAFVCQLLVQVRPGCDVLTLAAEEPRPLRDVVAALLAEIERPVELRVVPAPRSPFVVSIRKAAEQYGFAPSGVLETVRQFAQAPGVSPESSTSHLARP